METTFSGHHWISYVKVWTKACAQVSGAVNKETQKGKPIHVDIDLEKEYVMVGGKVQTNRVR